MTASNSTSKGSSPSLNDNNNAAGSHDSTTTLFDHKSIEARWSAEWLKHKIYRAHDFSPKPKKYILVEFPYPSGSGLHCGHVFRFTMPDIYARKLRMQGMNVLFPIGWDAFGLPAENYAIKTGVHPAVTTKQAIETYRAQLTAMGYSFDWDREVDTTAPEYFKWTQWIFLKFFEAGLAELREQPVWWCETLKTVLANEEVVDDGKGGKLSERGEYPVVKRPLKQWVLKMPAYAEQLLKGLELVDFPPAIKIAQTEWIGKSEGAKIDFSVAGSKSKISVFTTRPDTILGATFLVIAPEHPIIEELKGSIRNLKAVNDYRTRTESRSDLERKAAKEKTGVKLEGVEVDHPLIAGKKLPVFAADYVLLEYGTGAIMAVPAHDERDFEFAQKFNLPVVATVFATAESVGAEPELPFIATDGFVSCKEPEVRALLSIADAPLPADKFGSAVISALTKKGCAERRVTFKMRDWLFSRQRYWGEPIPLVHKADGSIEAVAFTDDPISVNANLPLKLPEVPDYEPSSDGTSPLAKNTAWVTTKAKDGSPAKRETNTMPNWAGSCWYYLRYIDPHNADRFAADDKLRYWLPVDKYFGGSEHTTMHLLYSRFWHAFLYDQKLVPTPEPYAWRMSGGVLLGADGQKMSKSVGNVINPDDKVATYGCDALRLYINFMGPYDGTMPWSESGLKACRKLVDRISALESKVKPNGIGADAGAAESEKLLRAYHKCVRKVSSMIDNVKTNTAVSEFMILVREFEQHACIPNEIWLGFIKLIAPFTVFLSEELWQKAHKYPAFSVDASVHLQSWPTFDEQLAFDAVVIIGVQVNGKLREQVQLAPDADEPTARSETLSLPGLKKWVEGKEIKKFIYVPGRIVNVIVS